jgi:hypothetical protein
MKSILHYPVSIYLAAGLACLCIMIIVDYALGAKAEHLNAWVIINRLIGRDIEIPDGMALRPFGLTGATILMLGINVVFGAVLIQFIQLTIRIFHS